MRTADVRPEGSIAVALRTRMWCVSCRRVRPMDEVDRRIWGTWRCRMCHRDRPQRLERLEVAFGSTSPQRPAAQ